MAMWMTRMPRRMPTGEASTSQSRYELKKFLASLLLVSPTRRSMVGVSVDLNFTKQYMSTIDTE